MGSIPRTVTVALLRPMRLGRAFADDAACTAQFGSPFLLRVSLNHDWNPHRIQGTFLNYGRSEFRCGLSAESFCRAIWELEQIVPSLLQVPTYRCGACKPDATYSS